MGALGTTSDRPLVAARSGDRPRTRRGPTSFAYRAALDGIRGLAVAAVLVFHAGHDVARGGYLGVSAFFTLSGFLITTLLLTETSRTATVDLRAFWVRRFRRLLPASLLGIALATAYTVAVGDGAAFDRFRVDALAALAYVANWRFVLSDLSYAELFAGESPLQHLWSLAIEEQFYLVLPLVVAWVSRGRPIAGRLARLATTGVVLSVATSILLRGDDRLYYGTDTRAAELLVGVLLAAWYHDGRLDAVPDRVRTGLGAASGALLLVSWSVVDQGSDWLHPWGLLAHAVLTAVVVWAATAPGPVAAALAARPLVALGVISYGVYVFHWPLFLWLSPERTGLDGLALDALRVAVTLVLAVASHRLVEGPIRHGRVSFGRVGPAVTAGAIAATAALVVTATVAVDSDPTIDFAAIADAADRRVDARTDTASADDPAAPTTAAPSTTLPVAVEPPPWAGRTPVLAVFGDSTALMAVPGLTSWAVQTGSADVLKGSTGLGCSLGRQGERRGSDGEMEVLAEACRFDLAWGEPIERIGPDIAFVQIGIWDLVDRKLHLEETERTLDDPVYETYLRGELRAANEYLTSRVGRVVWSLQPTPVSSGTDHDGIVSYIPRFNDLLLDELGDDPRVSFVDVDGWLDAHPDGTESRRLRPDGVHFTEETSVEQAEFLGPAIVAAATQGGVIGPDDVDPVDLEIIPIFWGE